MGAILSLSGIGVYKAIAHAHWVALNRELESVAGTLHDSLELKLKQPGRISPVVKQLLPDICLTGKSCLPEQNLSQRHILEITKVGLYYIRFFDNSGRSIADAGVYPEKLSQIFNAGRWQNLQDSKGNRYRQISLSLHTQDNRDWGYLQVGRSFKEFDEYLAYVRWILYLGLPTAIILIGISSCWLAGLAMRPIYQSYRQIQQFTADAAHELRTPLAAAQATVESALREPYLPEKEARNILGTIHRQNQRLIQYWWFGIGIGDCAARPGTGTPLLLFSHTAVGYRYTTNSVTVALSLLKCQ